MKKSFYLIIVSTALLLASCGAEVDETAETAEETPKYVVQTMTLEEGASTYPQEYIGTVESKDDVEVSGKVGGTIRTVSVKEGQNIKKGDVIAELLPGGDQKEAIQINYELAQANHETAESNLNRVREITKTSEKAAQSNVTQVQISIDNLNKQINDIQKSTDTAKGGLNIAVSTAQLSVNNLNDIINQTLANNQIQLSLADTSVSIAEKSYAVAQDSRDNSQDAVELSVDQAELAVDQLEETLDYLEASQTNPPNPEIDAQIFQTELQLESAKKALKAAQHQEDTVEDQTDSSVDLQGLQYEAARRQNDQIKSSLDIQLSNLYDQLEIARKQLEAAQYNLNSTDVQNDVQKDALKNQINALNEQKKLAVTNLDSIKISSAQQIAQAELQVKQAKSNLDQVALQLKDYTIKAPIDGVVEEVFVDAGEDINPGTPVVTIIQPNNFVIALYIPWQAAEYVDITKPVKITVGDEIFEGVVDVSSVTVDRDTQTVKYEITADISIEKQFINKLVEVEMQFSMENGDGKIFIPLSAINIGNETMSVFTVSTENQVTETNVETGEVIGDKIEVRTGLEFGQQIVIEGQRSIKDGQYVTIETNQE